MENHPIPQDVTGFKFRLIGSITVKQFLYLLGAGILCVVVFIFPLPFFIKIPFMMLFGAVGAGLAFVPVEGRPMDVMIINFVKVLPAENRYIYRKRGANFFAYEFLRAAPRPSTPHPKEDQSSAKRSLLISQLRNSSYRPDEKEIDFMKNIKTFFEETAYTTAASTPTQQVPAAVPVPTPKTSPTPPPTPAPEPKQTTADNEAIELGKQALALQKQIQQTQQEEKIALNKEELEQQITSLQEQLNSILSQRDSLEKKVIEFEKEKTEKKAYIPTEAAPEPEKTVNARVVTTPQSQLQAGFPVLPDTPNVVLGIIKDPRGKVLPNILVEVVDQNNIPVRAFKTNALGQFASATPLQNGAYKVFFEDPRKQHEFDTIEINLTGEIFHPLEVFSVDQREKLRRELFQN